MCTIYNVFHLDSAYNKGKICDAFEKKKKKGKLFSCLKTR